MKLMLQVTLLLLVVVNSGGRYYGYTQKNVYGGYNFYSANKTFVGQSRTDYRGGYSYWNNTKKYQGYQRGGNGTVYVPGVVK